MPIPTKAPRELSVLAGSFNDMAVKLHRAQDTERDFLLSVGHELKTPLTAIEGYAELLADGAVEPQQAAEVLGLESARLRRLIGDLLDLARIGRSEFSVLDEDGRPRRDRRRGDGALQEPRVHAGRHAAGRCSRAGPCPW